jgi:3-hydroxyisobutyrate dehydrogenase-like beta-hydroxyacid dehydrogenase
MNKKIGFIGLGNMGINMAKNLIAGGYHLQVYNRSNGKADALEQSAITRCETPAEAAVGVQIIISMLSDDSVVKEVVSGENGILQTLPKNGVHISMSTISPMISREMAKLHEDAGSNYIAAPVFGRPESAAIKKLWICMSGDKNSKEAARPALECMSQGIYDFGEDVGGANVVKITGNFMLFASVEVMAEAFTLAEKHGLNRTQVADFFGSTLFNAPVYQNYGKLIANHQYEPVGFKAKLGYKDAALAFSLSQQSETPMPMCTVVHNRMLTAVAKGWGERDCAEALGRGVSEDAGV